MGIDIGNCNTSRLSWERGHPARIFKGLPACRQTCGQDAGATRSFVNNFRNHANFQHIWAMLIFALLMLPFCACASENPDVATIEEAVEVTVVEEKSPFGRWGAILPVPEKIEGELVVGTVYQNSNQEIIIRYLFGPYNAKTTRFFNFSQGKIEVECKTSECPTISDMNLKLLEEEKVSLAKYTSFGGGIRPRISGGPQTSTPMDQGYETLLPDGTSNYEKIIWVSDGRASSLRFRFYQLEDVLLGLAFNNPIAVVFKNNLTSPYFEDNKSLIKMDGNLADSIYRVCSADARVKNPLQNIEAHADFLRQYDPESNHIRITQDIASACFAETIKDGISESLKDTFEKKQELFYVKKDSDDSNNDFGEKWGAFLPLPEDYSNSTVSVSGVYTNEKQEIVILYAFNVKGETDRFWRIFNFSLGTVNECQADDQKKSQFCIDEKIADFNEIRAIYPSVNTPINEGFSVIGNLDWGSYALRPGGYEVTSSNGDVRYEKIIWVSPEKREVQIYSGDLEAKTYNHIHAESLIISKLFILNEKTVLGVASEKPIVILFRNDITSPFLENNPSLIQIDGKRIDSVYGNGGCFSDSYKVPVKDTIERMDQCLIEFLKGEYPWLN